MDCDAAVRQPADVMGCAHAVGCVYDDLPPTFFKEFEELEDAPRSAVAVRLRCVIRDYEGLAIRHLRNLLGGLGQLDGGRPRPHHESLRLAEHLHSVRRHGRVER
jgi:hypothetical protein